MVDEPTPRQHRLAVLIFLIIVMGGLALTAYFLLEGGQEVDEADSPEEGELVGHAVEHFDDMPIRLTFQYALPDSIL